MHYTHFYPRSGFFSDGAYGYMDQSIFLGSKTDRVGIIDCRMYSCSKGVQK